MISFFPGRNQFVVDDISVPDEQAGQRLRIAGPKQRPDLLARNNRGIRCRRSLLELRTHRHTHGNEQEGDANHLLLDWQLSLQNATD